MMQSVLGQKINLEDLDCLLFLNKHCILEQLHIYRKKWKYKEFLCFLYQFFINILVYFYK